MAPQVLEFIGSQFKHEILGKPVDIPPHISFQNLGFHFVKLGKSPVQQDLGPANGIDTLSDILESDRDCSPAIEKYLPMIFLKPLW